VAHFLSEYESITVVSIDIVTVLGKQTNIFAANNPALHGSIPRDLHVLSVGF